MNIHRDVNQLNGAGKDYLVSAGIFFLGGMLMGVAAKYSDTAVAQGLWGAVLELARHVTTRLGLWVLLGTLIAAGSKSPAMAAVRVPVFFLGMLLAYYIYSRALFGFFPTYYFLRWGLIVLLSPFAAYLVWFGRGTGWWAAFCAGLPIGLLLSQGYPFFYMFSPVMGFDLLAALLMLWVLTKQKEQRLKTGLMSILIGFILFHTSILSHMMGGL